MSGGSVSRTLTKVSRTLIITRVESFSDKNKKIKKIKNMKYMKCWENPNSRNYVCMNFSSYKKSRASTTFPTMTKNITIPTITIFYRTCNVKSTTHLPYIYAKESLS